MGKLRKAMYGTRDAPHIWSVTVKQQMMSIWIESSVLHPSLYWHKKRAARSPCTVHVEDSLCIGKTSELQWMYKQLQGTHDSKCSMLEPGSEKEVRYLTRVLRGGDGVEWECGPQHASMLLRLVWRCARERLRQ